jgi:hypothetical protein
LTSGVIDGLLGDALGVGVCVTGEWMVLGDECEGIFVIAGGAGMPRIAGHQRDRAEV